MDIMKCAHASDYSLDAQFKYIEFTERQGIMTR